MDHLKEVAPKSKGIFKKTIPLRTKVWSMNLMNKISTMVITEPGEISIEGSHRNDEESKRIFLSHLHAHQSTEVIPNAACQAASFCKDTNSCIWAYG